MFHFGILVNALICFLAERQMGRSIAVSYLYSKKKLQHQHVRHDCSLLREVLTKFKMKAAFISRQYTLCFFFIYNFNPFFASWTGYILYSTKRQIKIHVWPGFPANLLVLKWLLMMLASMADYICGKMCSLKSDFLPRDYFDQFGLEKPTEPLWQHLCVMVNSSEDCGYVR